MADTSGGSVFGAAVVFMAALAMLGRVISAGIDKLSGQGRGKPGPAARLCGGRRCDPNAIGICSKEAKGGSADHVALRVEGVVDGGVGGKKSLG